MSETKTAIKTLNGHPLTDTGAREMAETAQTTANKAQTAAETAQSTAETAKTNAATAQSTADTAKTNAATAQSTADTAKTNAATAQSTAETAKSKAEANESEISSLKTRVTQAESKITPTAIVSTVTSSESYQTLSSTASTAKTTAETAKTTAETAKTTAETAKTTAETAQSTATAAKNKADELEAAMSDAVTSVNGKTGAVQLSAEDVGALPDDTVIPAAYTLPTASATTKGGVKIGSGLQMSGEALQVKPEQYELIETITTTEVMSIVRTEEPDGTPYNFKALTLRIKKPADVTLSAAINMYVQIHPTITVTQSLYMVSTSSTAEQWSYCSVLQNRGVWERERSNGWSVYNSTITPMYVKIPSFDVPVVSGENISKLGGTSVPAGLTIEIWGIRA